MENLQKESKWWQKLLVAITVMAIFVGAVTFVLHDYMWPSKKLFGVYVPDLINSHDAWMKALQVALSLCGLMGLGLGLLSRWLLKRKPHLE